MFYICGRIMEHRLKLKVEPLEAGFLEKIGYQSKEVRCTCGKKLMEVVLRGNGGDWVLIKCGRCGRVMRVSI